MNGLKNDIYDIADRLQTPEHEAAIQLGVVRKCRNSISEISGNNMSVDKIKEELEEVANQLEMYIEYTEAKQNELRIYAAQVGEEDEWYNWKQQYWY